MKGKLFTIGGKTWPGLGKLVEECGEVTQVVGKLMGTGGDVQHWDGEAPLDVRLIEELGDLLAAIDFVIGANKLPAEAIAKRRTRKLELFQSWHRAKVTRP